MMTLQEVFDKVKSHLLTQGEKSYADFKKATTRDMDLITIGCAYRGKGGRKCAVGVLILDECYSPDLENKGVYHEPVIRALKHSRIPVTQMCLDLLESLQFVHDAHQVKEWPERLAEVALSFELNP